MAPAPRKQSKTYKVPKRPYEAARLDAELKVGLMFRLFGDEEGLLEEWSMGYGWIVR
jgi:hypothetical protein